MTIWRTTVANIKPHFLMITVLEISLRQVASSCFYTAIRQNASERNRCPSGALLATSPSTRADIGFTMARGDQALAAAST